MQHLICSTTIIMQYKCFNTSYDIEKQEIEYIFIHRSIIIKLL